MFEVVLIVYCSSLYSSFSLILGFGGGEGVEVISLYVVNYVFIVVIKLVS